MSLHHKFLSGAYYPLKLAKAIGRPIGLTASNRLRVLLHHDIAPHEQARFGAELRWLARTWTFVTPEHFAAMVSGMEPIRGSNLLLTFDDGLASNLVVAEQVLNPLGIRALFFVVSDLVDIEDRQEARRFIARNIYLGTRADELPAHWHNIGWGDLHALLKQGHSIGSHTRTHKRLSLIHTKTELEHEIISGADTLEQRLGVAIDHFSYPFGDLASFSESALSVAKRRFRFIHSGLRGDNAGGVSPFTLRRDSSALQDTHSNYKIFSNSLIGAFLEGAADFKYARDISLLSRWSRLSNEVSN